MNMSTHETTRITALRYNSIHHPKIFAFCLYNKYPSGLKYANKVSLPRQSFPFTHYSAGYVSGSTTIHM